MAFIMVINFIIYPLLEHIVKIFKLTRASMNIMYVRARERMHTVEREWKREGVVFSQSLIFLILEAISFLIIIKMKQEWVGGIFFIESIASQNKAYSFVSIHEGRWKNWQGICMLIKVTRYPSLFHCSQIKV